MTRFYLLLLSVLSLFGGSKYSYGAESPCYFGGDYVKCFPVGGIWLDDQRALRLGELVANGTNYVELISAPDMSSNWQAVWPATHGTLGQVLSDSDGNGVLGWADAGASTSYVDGKVNSLGSKQVADLVCHSNVTLSGIQTCDGQATTSAGRVLLMGQTDPTENGLWNNDDFGAWTRSYGWSNIDTANPGSLITVNEQGGGTSYQDTLWFGIGTGGSDANYHLIPTTASNTQLTASKAMVTDANSHLSTSATTATELGYVSGVTSAIQTQLNAKSTNPGTTTGDIDYCSNTATPCTLARLGIGTSGTVLHGGSTPSYSLIVNADVDPSAAIAYSKLNLSGSIVNADVNASAAIDGTKIVSASSGANGVVTASGTQTFGGNKTFNGNVAFATGVNYTITVDSSTTGANASLAHPTTFIYLSNASLTSIGSIVKTSVTDGTVVTIVNKTGAAITLVNNYGSAPGTDDVILTGSGANLVLQNNGSATFILAHANALAWFVSAVNQGITQIAQGGTGAATKAAAFDALSPMSANGDIIYGGAAGTGTRLAPSTSVTLLHSGTTPSWSAVSLTADVSGLLPLSSGGTNKNMTPVAGGICYTDSDSLEVSAAGTSGQIFTSSGAGAPTWVTLVPVANGGTNLASGTSGGVLGYTASGTLASSGALTANGVVLGGGAGATPTSTAAGTNNQVLIGNTSSAPTWGTISSTASFSSGAYNDGTNAGTLPTVTNMSDSLATQLGLKQYLSGTNYNSSISPTISGTNWTTTRASYVPYQMQGGTWRLRFNIRGAVSSGTIATITLSINGVTFKNTANYDQSFSAFVVGNAPYTASGQTDINNGNLLVYFASFTAPSMLLSGDVELESKPTWAY